MTARVRPNIVLVMTDQHRGDCLGAAGHPHVLTPTLDALAGRGTRFRNAFSECPTCIPARHALMTGLLPGQSGVVGFSTTARIADPAQTLPALLAQAGYQTASVGRSMHTHPGHARYGFQHTAHDPFADPYSVFHEQFFRYSRKGRFSNWPHLNLHGLPSNGWTARPWPYEERFHQTNWAVAQAVSFLDKRDRDAPFFLSVGFVAPHPPLVPPGAYYDRYARRTLDRPVIGDWVPTPHPPPTAAADAPELVLGEHASQVCRAGYYGLINHVDDQLNALVERLSAEPGPLVLVFTSDHGEMLGDHHCFRKALPFQSAANVPMIAVGEGFAANTVCDAPIGLTDLMPTFLRAAGLNPPPDRTGIALQDSAAGTRRRDTLHLEHAPLGHRWGGWHALTDGTLKYVWFAGSGRELLFDLRSDPSECHDLSTDAAWTGVLTQMRDRLIDRLRSREEGFVDQPTNALQPGRRYLQAQSHARTDRRTEAWEQP